MAIALKQSKHRYQQQGYTWLDTPHQGQIRSIFQRKAGGLAASGSKFYPLVSSVVWRASG